MATNEDPQKCTSSGCSGCADCKNPCGDGTALLEDVPQITIAGLYLWSTGGIDVAANPDDVVPVVSLIASCFFLVFGFVGGCVESEMAE